MVSFDNLERLVSAKNFYGSKELQNLMTKVGVDVDELEERNMDLENTCEELLRGNRRFMEHDE